MVCLKTKISDSSLCGMFVFIYIFQLQILLGVSNQYYGPINVTTPYIWQDPFMCDGNRTFENVHQLAFIHVPEKTKDCLCNIHISHLPDTAFNKSSLNLTFSGKNKRLTINSDWFNPDTNELSIAIISLYQQRYTLLQIPNSKAGNQTSLEMDEFRPEFTLEKNDNFQGQLNVNCTDTEIVHPMPTSTQHETSQTSSTTEATPANRTSSMVTEHEDSEPHGESNSGLPVYVITIIAVVAGVVILIIIIGLLVCFVRSKKVQTRANKLPTVQYSSIPQTEVVNAELTADNNKRNIRSKPANEPLIGTGPVYANGTEDEQVAPVTGDSGTTYAQIDTTSLVKREEKSPPNVQHGDEQGLTYADLALKDSQPVEYANTSGGQGHNADPDPADNLYAKPMKKQ